MPSSDSHDGKNITIRRAVKDDVDTVSKFNMGCAADSEGVTLDYETVRKGFLIMIEQPSKGHYYVAEVDGQPAGQLMITYEWSDWRAADAWWIQSVFIEAKHRRKGIFRLLYRHARQEAQAAGACGLRLYADNDNMRAQSTYRALGMTSHYMVFEDLFVDLAMTKLP